MGDQKLAPRDKSNVARHRVFASKARKGKAINVEGKDLPKHHASQFQSCPPLVNNLPTLPLNSLKSPYPTCSVYACESYVESIHVTGFHQFYPHGNPLVKPFMLDFTPATSVYKWEGPTIIVVGESVFAHPR